MNNNVDKIVPQLFDVIIFAIDGCLKTCIFSDIWALLRQSIDLLHNDALSDEHKQRVLRRCWESYWMLGDEEILKLIVDIYAISGTVFTHGVRTESFLESLFFESIPIAHESRNQLRLLINRGVGRSPEVNDAILDFAEARSAWLALTAAPYLSNLGVTILLRAVLESLVSTEALVHRAWERSQEQGQSKLLTGVRLTDVMTLSAAMWCLALRCNQHVLFSIDN
jgi:hypothetical protein